jgi:glycosyltransferase involved in cell wall biosynthesis
MTELRVLHVITRLIVGGAQENTLLTAIGQHRMPGFRVTLLAGIDDGPEGNLHEEARVAGVNMTLMRELVRPIAPFTDAVALVKLASLMHRGRYDIVHTHSSKAGILGRIAARAAGVPIVVHTLHSLVFGEHASPLQNGLYVSLKRLVAPLTDRFVSVCDATRRGALERGIGRPEQHCVIYSGFAITPFLEARDRLSVADAKRRVGLSPDHLVVGKLARISHQKGHEYFVQAARQISASEPKARFLLVGDGNQRAAIERQIEELGLRQRFVLTGLVPPTAVPALLQAMDVVVHTSIREGLARAIPQAAAVGKPVVGFALDGTPEVVKNGETGFCVAPYNAAAVAERVIEILSDAERRRKMGERGRRLVAEEFSVETMVRKTSALYLALQGEPRRVRRKRARMPTEQ